MSTLEDLKTLQNAVRKELPIIKNLLAHISPAHMSVDGKEAFNSTVKAIVTLQSLVQTDSGNISITVPVGHLGAKGQ